MKTIVIVVAILSVASSSRDSDIIGICSQEQSNEFDLAISRPLTFSDTNNTFPDDATSALAFCR